MNQYPETVYIGYTKAEIAARAAAEREAYQALSRLALKWQRRAECEKALARLETQIHAAKEAEPFELTRVVLRSKVAPASTRAPASGVRRRNRGAVRFLSQGVAAIVAALVG